MQAPANLYCEIEEDAKKQLEDMARRAKTSTAYMLEQIVALTELDNDGVPVGYEPPRVQNTELPIPAA